VDGEGSLITKRHIRVRIGGLGTAIFGHENTIWRARVVTREWKGGRGDERQKRNSNVKKGGIRLRGIRALELRPVPLSRPSNSLQKHTENLVEKKISLEGLSSSKQDILEKAT